MLLTNKEASILENSTGCHCLSHWMRVFSSVIDQFGREVAPAMVRFYYMSGCHFDMLLRDLPEEIQDKVYRHFNVE
jgi:hypothetical protein